MNLKREVILNDKLSFSMSNYFSLLLFPAHRKIVI